jgi:drug/metabolite transporter (DMT)-like permease
MLSNSPLLKPILLACLGSILIGTSAIFVRLSELGPMTTGFYRMLFSLPLLAIWMGWEKREGLILSLFPIKEFLGLILAGAFFAADLALWNWAIDRTTIVNSTLFNNTAAFFVPLIMWVFFREKQSLRVIMAALACFIGCIFLIGDNFSISIKNLLGDIVALCSGVTVALYLITLKRIRDEVSTGLLMFWTGGFSVIFLAFCSHIFGEVFWPLTFKDLASVLGQAILVHALGQSLLAYSLGKIPASYAALILFLAPATAAFLGWVFYAETLSLIKILGMILIMVSIIAITKNP